ncbi:hypothetical protein LguiB_033973 [Lonicera macranthoides]
MQGMFGKSRQKEKFGMLYSGNDVRGYSKLLTQISSRATKCLKESDLVRDSIRHFLTAMFCSCIEIQTHILQGKNLIKTKKNLTWSHLLSFYNEMDTLY